MPVPPKPNGPIVSFGKPKAQKKVVSISIRKGKKY